MNDIIVVNQSKLVSDKEVGAMVRACSYQLHNHAAPLWGKEPMTVHHGESVDEAQPGDWVIGIFDDSDEPGALGWHTEDADVVFGRVFAKPCFDAGSAALTGPYAVSGVLSHEVLETYVDPHINLWAEMSNGLAIAYEACDPVESDTYSIPIRGHGDVVLSDFITPDWADEQSIPGEKFFDFLKRVPRPFAMRPGGYWVQATLGGETQKFNSMLIDGMRLTDGSAVWEAKERGVTFVFGPEVPEWKREIKFNSPLGRSARRERRAA